jgi:anti-anti-sigma regulatory factor
MSTITDPYENEGPRSESPAGTVDVLTVRAPAELDDADTSARFLVPAAASPPGTAVVVDLSAVTYLTTEAVVPLVTLARHCLDDGRDLRVVASASARRKLTLLGLHTVLAVHPPA